VGAGPGTDLLNETDVALHANARVSMIGGRRLWSYHACSHKAFRDHRQVIEGTVYRYRAGIAWRDVPAEFGPWQTAWRRHRRFSLDGTWDDILAVLIADADAAGGLD
jgi:transposase